MLDDYRAYVAIVDQGSLSKAARVLGRSLSSVSRSLIAVEQSLGVSLVRRSTRSLVPTDAGLRFHAQLKAVLDALDQATAELAQDAAAVSGLVRIGASPLFAASHIVPLLAACQVRYPQLSIDLDVSDRHTDLFATGLDFAIRIGDLPDSTLRARALGSLRRVAFAAPSYLARHGTPAAPAELREHACVIRAVDTDGGSVWTFRHADGSTEKVTVEGRFRSGSALACNAAVLHGAGIGQAFLWQIREWVERDQVRLVLTDFEMPPVAVQAVWPGSAVLPARARALVDFLAEHMALDPAD
ncbi:hypothetical protein PATSB16_18090 [Pandoraea thiooxydans]|uniref:HTH lysR-type domain-containing protein n=1 Tax=Pandoraea thiooxydans TaxID=445709 RepID=A0A0G3ETE4_9BURK|nr:LysR family transcriptional regulator [Pandoraea thiooxydans]AKJ67941.1 hypothetical protein ABW99_06630 [Pandoraea thiooxydans]APR95151.1 hypothetical protein PATSB16_18090 [Pandoraea thiooxydans]